MNVPNAPTVSDVTYGVDPVVNVPNVPAGSDVTYGVDPVVNGFDPEAVNGQIAQVIMISPELLRLMSSGSDITQVTGPAPDSTGGGDSGSGEDKPHPVDIDTEDPDSPDGDFPPPAFAPNIVVNVYGNASEESVENMSDSLRDTVRELYDEFREEELQRMSLKNQYSY